MTKKIYTTTEELDRFINQLAATLDGYRQSNSYLSEPFVEYYRGTTGKEIEWLGNGHFSVVLASPDYENVVFKVGVGAGRHFGKRHFEDAWIKYAQYCVLNQDDPRTMAVYSLDVYEYFYISCIESLTVNRVAMWDSEATMMNYSAEYCDRPIPDHVRNGRDWLIIKERHAQEFLEWSDFFTKLFKFLPKGVQRDMHNDNWMMREDQPVITDPAAYKCTRRDTYNVVSTLKTAIRSNWHCEQEAKHEPRSMVTVCEEAAHRVKDANRLLRERSLMFGRVQPQMVVDEMLPLWNDGPGAKGGVIPQRVARKKGIGAEVEEFAAYFAKRLLTLHPNPRQALAVLGQHLRRPTRYLPDWMESFVVSRGVADMVVWRNRKDFRGHYRPISRPKAQAKVPFKTKEGWNFIRVDIKYTNGELVFYAYLIGGGRYVVRYPLRKVPPNRINPRNLGKRFFC